jgi:hypothetical protein
MGDYNHWDYFVPLSVRRGIRSIEDYEAGVQRSIDDPKTPQYVREDLIRGQRARRARIEAEAITNGA